MEHAERIAPCILLVQHSDRLARRGDARQARHLVEIVTWAVRVGVMIRRVEDDLFADERMAVLMGALMGQRNTEDSRRKSEAVQARMKRKAERGEFSGPAPYGYDYATNGEGLDQDGTCRRVLRRSDAVKVRGPERPSEGASASVRGVYGGVRRRERIGFPLVLR